MSFGFLKFSANESLTLKTIKEKLKTNTSSGVKHTTTSNFFQTRKKAFNTLPIFKAVCTKIASLSFVGIDEVGTSPDFIQSDLFKNLGIEEQDKGFKNLIEELCRDYVIYGTCIVGVEYSQPFYNGIQQIQKAVRIIRIDPADHDRVIEVDTFAPINRIKQIKINKKTEKYEFPLYVKPKTTNKGVEYVKCEENSKDGFLRWDFFLLDSADLSGNYTNYTDDTNTFDTLSRITRITTNTLDRTENDAENGFTPDVIVPVDREMISMIDEKGNIAGLNENVEQKNILDKFKDWFKKTNQNQKNGQKVMLLPSSVASDGTLNKPNVTVLNKQTFDQSIGATLHQMDLRLLQELGIEDPQIVGVKTAGSLGSSDLAEAKKSFHAEKVLPVSIAIENFLNKKILPLYNENWHVKFKVSEYVTDQQTINNVQ